jgi:hypothetical protein
MPNQWRYWDWAMFSLTASVTLWADLPTLDVAIVIVVLVGTMLGGAE